MTTKKILATCAAALCAGTGLALVQPHAAKARAEACPDVSVAFARGTSEAPGLGYMGEEFVDELKSRLPGKSVDVYAVDYPAVLSAESLGEGGNDLSRHVQKVARTCPNSKIVVGGFSQGAAVVDLVTVHPLPTEAIDVPFMGPQSLSDTGFDQTLPADVAPHIAAVAVFGNPAKRMFDEQLPMYDGLRGRTIDVCNEGDPVCHQAGSDDLANYHKHDEYIQNGHVVEAVDFVVGKLGLPVSKPTAAPPSANKPAPSDEDAQGPDDEDGSGDDTAGE